MCETNNTSQQEEVQDKEEQEEQAKQEEEQEDQAEQEEEQEEEQDEEEEEEEVPNPIEGPLFDETPEHEGAKPMEPNDATQLVTKIHMVVRSKPKNSAYLMGLVPGPDGPRLSKGLRGGLAVQAILIAMPGYEKRCVLL